MNTKTGLANPNPPPPAQTLSTRTNPLEIAELVAQHWGIATALANEYRNIPKTDFDDILQHARIGLAKAAKRFNPSKGTAFSTYAWRVIQNELNTLYTRQQRYASREMLSFDFTSYDTEEERPPCEDLLKDNKTNVFNEIQQREACRVLNLAITKLPERQKRVVRGILAGRDYRDIGKQLGFSQASAKTLVSRAYQNSLANLRLELEKQGFQNDCAPV